MILTARHRAGGRLGGKLGCKLGHMPVRAAACFIAGAVAGALIAPAGIGRVAESSASPAALASNAGAVLRSGHPADVLRVLDGDTFEARVHVWPGMDVTTRVRLRGIDAPEMHARCDAERARAQAARDTLARLLDEGSVGISRIGQDKYGGRVDADVSTARTADVAAAMSDRGLARRYGGGKRAGWCG